MSLFKPKFIITIIALLLITGVFFWIEKNNNTPKPNNAPTQPATTADQSNESPKIVSTKPDPLEDNIVAATDIIEITFNRPLENVGEFKSRMEPKIEYKVELSGDRKTARIIPAKPYALGTTYTFSIGPDSKFDGVGNWGEDKSFHFQTIKYNGV